MTLKMGLFTSVLMLASASAMADTTAQTTAAAGEVTPAPSLKDYLSISNLIWLDRGPQLTDPTNSLTAPGADEGKVATSPLAITNATTIVGKIGKGWTLGPVFLFDVTPVGKNPKGEGAEKDRGFDITRLDPYLKLKNGALVSGNGLSLMGEYRYYVPTTNPSHNLGTLGAVRAIHAVGYDVPNTRLNVNLYTFAQVRAFNNTDIEAVSGKSDQIRFYAAPNATYQLTPKLAATLWYDMLSLRKKVNSVRYKNDDMDIEPGLSWDITERVNLSPYLNIYPSSTYLLQSTSINATLNVAFL